MHDYDQACSKQVKKLLRDAEKLCTRRKMAWSELGEIIMNDRGFFSRLKKGADVTTATYAKVEQHISRLSRSPAS